MRGLMSPEDRLEAPDFGAMSVLNLIVGGMSVALGVAGLVLPSTLESRYERWRRAAVFLRVEKIGSFKPSQAPAKPQ